MRDVSIIGIGQTAVGEHWERSLRHLAGDAVLAAMGDAGIEKADALYAGNMLSGLLTGQEHLGTLIADFVGLRGEFPAGIGVFVRDETAKLLAQSPTRCNLDRSNSMRYAINCEPVPRNNAIPRCVRRWHRRYYLWVSGNTGRKISPVH